MSLSYPSDAARELRAAIRECTFPQLERVVEVLFFSSLLHEEGRGIVLTVGYAGHATPEDRGDVVPRYAVGFDVPDALTPSTVAKYALLASGDGEQLIVHCIGSDLMITGIAHHEPERWPRAKVLRVRIEGPGTLRFFWMDTEVLYYASGKTHKPLRWPTTVAGLAVQNVASALEEMVPVNIRVGSAKERPQTLARDGLWMLGSELVRRGHGGIIAVVDDSQTAPRVFEAQKLRPPIELGVALIERWEAYVKPDIAFKVMGYIDPDVDDSLEQTMLEMDRQCARVAKLIGRLTAVDGAVLVTPSLAAIAFRAKLPAPDRTPKVLRVLADGDREELDMRLRGTRHRSAASFVVASPCRLALIASADGPAAVMLPDEQGNVLYHPFHHG